MKIKKIVVTICLLVIYLTWISWASHELRNLNYSLSEWAGYIIITPMLYSFYNLVKKTDSIKRDISILSIITTGVFVSIFLVRDDLQSSFWVEKIIITFTGTLLTYLCGVRQRITKSKNIL